MIKLIIFDLDGVIVEAKNIHFESLNKALGHEYSIKWDEHLSIYDGLKTNQKLDMLTERKGLPKSLHKSIWDSKQLYTLQSLRNLKCDNDLVTTMTMLSNEGFKLVVCSNSIRKTVLTVLSKLGVIEFFDLILSNEDVKNSKPHPEIYWKAISMMYCLPEETLIIEDSPYGLLSASRSKSHVLRVKDPKETTFVNIMNKITDIKIKKTMTIPKWKDNKMNILIPMAGAGSRFEKAGYCFPKPLIDVNGKPMIQLVIENLNMDANYIFVVQKSHREKYNLDTLLNLIVPNCNIVEVDGLTEGAACTALISKDYINNDNPLFFANSDQFVEWDSNEFMYKMQETNCDGGIVTFESTHPKWSFVKTNTSGLVTEVAEKNPISNIATVGFYYWKHGSDFVKYAEKMIEENIRINDEFYVCPVFNLAIEDNKQIRTFRAEKMWGLGTPEDLNFFIENNK
jgi:HAD superfamily hydrolase (TIGR01509 family)